MLKPRLSQYVLSSFCVVGFLVQVGYISQSYFRYKTITRIDMKLQWELHVPVVTFCAKYVDVVDRQRLVQETGITIGRVLNEAEIEVANSKLTIKQIFKYTPAAKDILTGCSFRDVMQSRLVTLTGSANCNDRFDVLKFYMHDLICYRFTPKTLRMLSFEKVSNSINSSGTMFHVDLNESLNGTAIMSVIVYDDRLPYYSRRFAPKINRMSDKENQEASSNTYRALFQLFETHLLPHPYDTDCDKGTDSQSTCFSECMMHLFKVNLDRVPYNVIVLDDTLEIKHLSSLDMEDENVTRMADEIENACSAKCAKFSCDDSYTLTTIYSAYRKIQTGLSIYLMTPFAPTSRSYAEAQMSLTEFFTYVFSCFGTWFGISFLSIAPIFKMLRDSVRCPNSVTKTRHIKVYPSS